jgi:hypothetical protein
MIVDKTGFQPSLGDLFADVSNPVTDVFEGVRFLGTSALSQVSFVAQKGAYQAYKTALQALNIQSIVKEEVEILEKKTGSCLFENFFLSFSKYLTELSKRKLKNAEGPYEPLLQAIGEDPKLGEILEKVLLKGAVNLVNHTAQKRGVSQVDLVDVLLFFIEEFEGDFRKIGTSSGEEKEKEIKAFTEKFISRVFPKGAEELPLIDFFGLGFEFLKTKIVPLWVESLQETVLDLFGTEEVENLKKREGGETLFLIAKRVGELLGKENGPFLVSDFKKEIGDLIVDFFEPGQKKQFLSDYLAQQIDKLAKKETQAVKTLFSFASQLVTRLVVHSINSLVKNSDEPSVSLFFKKIKRALLVDSGKELFETLLKEIECKEGHLFVQAPRLKEKIIPDLIDSYIKDVRVPLKKADPFLEFAKPLAALFITTLKAEGRGLATTLCHLFSQEFNQNDVEALLLGIDVEESQVKEFIEMGIASLIAQTLDGLKEEPPFLILEEIVDSFLESGQEGVREKTKALFVRAQLTPSGIPLPSPKLQKLAFEAMRDRVLPDFLSDQLALRAPFLKEICLRLNWKNERSFKQKISPQGRFLFNKFDDLISVYKSPIHTALDSEEYSKIFEKAIETCFFYSLEHMVGSDEKTPLLNSLFKKSVQPFLEGHPSDKIYEAFLDWMNLREFFEVKEIETFSLYARSKFNEVFRTFSGHLPEYLEAKKSFLEVIEDKETPLPLSGVVTVRDVDRAKEEYLVKKKEIVEKIEGYCHFLAEKLVVLYPDVLISEEKDPILQEFFKSFSSKSEEIHQKAFFSWMTERIKETLFIGFLGLSETVKEGRVFKLEALPSQVIDFVVLLWERHREKISFETIYQMREMSEKDLIKAQKKVYEEIAPFSKELMNAAFKTHLKALPFPEEVLSKVWHFLENEGIPAFVVTHIQSLHGVLKEKENLKRELRQLFGTNYLNETVRVLSVYAKQALQEFLKEQSKVYLKEFPKEFSLKVDDSLEGFSVVWEFIQDRLETTLLEFLLGFSEKVKVKEEEKQKGGFLKELLKEFLTLSQSHFKAFNEITVSQKKGSASQIPKELFLEELRKRGVTNKAKEDADALQRHLRETFKKPKIEYFQLKEHTYLEKYSHFLAYFEETPKSENGRFKQWKLKDKKLAEVVCEEAQSIALTEMFFVPLTDQLFKMSEWDDLSRLPGEKEIGKETLVFLKGTVLPGLLKKIFDSLMSPGTLYQLMDRSLEWIKNVECLAEQEQIKENERVFKGVIDLMGEALRSENSVEKIKRQIEVLERCRVKFREVQHALTNTLVFIHLEEIDLRAKSFLEASKEPLKDDEVNSAKTALEKSLSDATQKLYTKPPKDDENSIKEFNETCGQLVLEMISFIPHVLTKPILETENIQRLSQEAVGKAILQTLNEGSWTVLKGVSKIGEKVAGVLHEGKFEGEAHTAIFHPKGGKFDFYSGVPTTEEKKKASQEKHTKVVNDLAKAVYDQVIQTLSRSLKSYWDEFQKVMDEFIDEKFGEKGRKVKSYLDKQFHLIFVKGFGAFLSFFFYHMFLPLFWMIDLYNKSKIKDFIKNGEHEAHKHLILNLMERFFNRVALSN